MRAKLRKDLLELAGYTDDRLPWEAGVLASVAGRSLLVENVTVHAVTLLLPRTVWRSRVSGAGSAVFGAEDPDAAVDGLRRAAARACC